MYALEKLFHCVTNLHENIKSIMEEEHNGEVVLLDNLLK